MNDQNDRNKAFFDQQGRKMSQLIARCWSDETYKRKFVADPVGTFKAEGIATGAPERAAIKVVEDSEKLVHLVIPNRPNELSDEDLDQVAGGALDKCQMCCVPPCVLLTAAKT
jgi:hypothetical protein